MRRRRSGDVCVRGMYRSCLLGWCRYSGLEIIFLGGVSLIQGIEVEFRKVEVRVPVVVFDLMP